MAVVRFQGVASPSENSGSRSRARTSVSRREVEKCRGQWQGEGIVEGAHVPTSSCRLVTSRAILRTSTTRNKTVRHQRVVGAARHQWNVSRFRFSPRDIVADASIASHRARAVTGLLISFRTACLQSNIYVNVSQLISRVVQTLALRVERQRGRRGAPRRTSSSIDTFDVHFGRLRGYTHPNLAGITDNVSPTGKLSIAQLGPKWEHRR